jgi:hypothetical protein
MAMPDYTDLREQLRRARENRESAGSALAAARERLQRLVAQRRAHDRVFDRDDQQRRRERARLDATQQELQGGVDFAQAAYSNARALEAGILREFGPFTDPRTNIGRLNDLTPILMMPVRLETRFKAVRIENRVEPQLWVRIFPDDCWIDSFEPQLTDSEVENARTYWMGVWKAAGIEDQRRAAWRTLVVAHGSGRARWIVSNYQPVNVATPPVKARPQDVILTIPTETALAAAEEAAASTYWRAVWLADGAAAGVEAARAALNAAVGAPRAAEIVRDYVPQNLDSPLPASYTKAQVNVAVALVVFAAVETKQNAWSMPPRATCLPERFVFIGYRGADPPLIVAGAAVPATLVVGPDPSAPEAEQLKHDADGNLVLPPELQWIADFDRAVADGMGFRIPLTGVQAREGFDRVLIVGIRLGADEQTSRKDLELLFQHHANSRKGLAVVPQGTPTNNTEGASSGLQRLDDPDESFDANAAPLFTPDANWLDKRDGQWLAEYLGIDPTLLQHTHGAGTTDQGAARAMNEALWPATLGYWMETMMAPVFSRDAIDETRAFFNRYVVGGGAVPALRIGSQPYGVLPATAFSRAEWFRQGMGGRGAVATAFVRKRPQDDFLARLHALLMAMYADWGQRAADVSFVGRDGGDPHALLLDIVGLHSGSVEWAERYAESLQTVFNRLNLMGFGGMIQAIILAAVRAAAAAKLQQLGGGTAAPFILGELFSGRHQELRGGVVDDRPLSEQDRIRVYTTGGANYIQWLIDAANESLEALYRQAGFVNDTPPTALLYLLLRHALQLGYHDVSVTLHVLAGLYSPEAAKAARMDDPFIHIRESAAASESRYAPLYAIAPPITGSATVPVHRFIASQLASLPSAFGLRDQLDALERLKGESTARLERTFADHVDCCSYRLDAWILGIVHYQLALMRNLRDGRQDEPRRGIHLGAYAWLEEVRPENKELSPVRIADPAVAADFMKSPSPLMRDSSNQGYVHTPSSNHAVAAAVLRNGFISDASPENRQTMAVNLTSERVRTALGFLEGIRGGQGLADLLGYQFERGLHDRHSLAEVDKFIYKLRKAFPLRADRLKATRTDEGVSIESIEARNVIDGLALAEHIKSTGNKNYPFGKTGLPAATDLESAAIDLEADRLLESHDAVADLALAEGVYQAVVGNYDRVASTYDAYARGNFPPEPDIIRTPFEGIGITHRIALHFEPGVSSGISPVGGIAMTPRAQAEPAVNKWLAGILPPLAQVSCTVTFRDAAAGEPATREVTLDQLGLQPADIVAILQDGNEQAMSELDDRVVHHAVLNFGPRPDVTPSIAYMNNVDMPYSVFQLMPLVRHVRRVITRSRPLRPTDATLLNEAKPKQDDNRRIDKSRLDLVRAGLQTLKSDADTLATALQGPLSDLQNRRNEILADVDTYVADVTALLSRAVRFVIVQAGWGFAYDFRQRTFAAILDQAAARVKRWDDKLTEFTDWLNKEAALPGTATDVERFVLLQKAERSLSTTLTTPLPATPALFRTALTTVLQPAFVAKRNQFDALKNTTRTEVSQLLTDLKGMLPVTAFDDAEYSVTPHEDQMVRFTEDAVSVLGLVSRECTRRLEASQTQYDTYAAAASVGDQLRALESAAKALLGEDFVVIPEFTLDGSQADELDNACQASRSGALFTYLTTPQPPSTTALEDFPVDTWLYGVARVREKMHAWEQMMMLAGSFGRPEPILDPLQLPFVPGDQWVGLEIPTTQALDHDRVLYTAHFSTPFAKNAAQCGLLVDEWTETIPGPNVNTGIAFHHDRPNCEAPQCMLLLTPTRFRGEWQWNDVVDALNETLTFAKRRAVEPRHIDATPYAWFLPATTMAAQVRQLTIAANLALNNRVAEAMPQT